MKLLTLYARLMWARLTRNSILALATLKEMQMLTFDAMDAAISDIANKIAADKAALDSANATLTTAQTDLANAQSQLDQRTAAISAAIA